jgi:uncharacterized protein YigA (DUF484 family)
MDANDVAQYLKQNPKFFEDYADVIADIFVPHPHGGHAIPIAERQIVTLREKNAELESRLQEMLRFGGENDLISDRLHRSTLALIAAPDLETTLEVLYHSLKEDFGVPHVSCRLWGKVPEQSYLPELAAISQELRDYADKLGAPYCGPGRRSNRATGSMRDRTASRFFLPFRTAYAFGFLGLGDENAGRFHSGWAPCISPARGCGVARRAAALA